MSYSLKIKGAAFTNYISKVCPYLDLASVFYLLGGSAEESIINYANVAAPATVIGTPTFSEGFAVLSEANGLDSDIAGRTPFTHIVVATDLPTNAGYCGHWETGATNNLLNRAAGPLTTLSVGGAIRVDTPSVDTGFIFMAGSHDGATAKVYRRNATEMVVASAAYDGVSGAANYAISTPFRVGANGFGTGAFNCAAAMTFPSVLSDAQVAEIYAYLKELIADRGVVLV